jgi:beta-mannosidase
MSLDSFEQTAVQSLNSTNVYWEFHELNSSKQMPASVPGNVHADLMNNRVIPDPLIGTNEKDVQWVEGKTWEYKLTNFAVDPDVFEKQEVLLELKGVDTYAEVYLNGNLIGKCNNAFIAYRFNVKETIQQENNQLTRCARRTRNFTQPHSSVTR